MTEQSPRGIEHTPDGKEQGHISTVPTTVPTTSGISNQQTQRQKKTPEKRRKPIHSTTILTLFLQNQHILPILKLLISGDYSSCPTMVFAKAFTIPQRTAYQALKTMKKYDLVSTKKVGKHTVWYIPRHSLEDVRGAGYAAIQRFMKLPPEARKENPSNQSEEAL